MKVGNVVNLDSLYNDPENYNTIINYEGYVIYRIHNLITGKSYIGDTSVSIRHRFFDAWYGSHFSNFEDTSSSAHLYNSMRKYGLINFELEILSLSRSDREEQFITKYDAFRNGYNRSSHGLPYDKRSVVLGRIHIYNESTDQIKTIVSSEIDQYLQKGWILGQGPSKSKEKLYVHKDNIRRMIPKTEVDKYLSEGYSLSIGLSWVTKDGSSHLIDSSLINKYLQEGYKLGRAGTTTGLVFINRGRELRYVRPGELDEYKSKGWSKHSIGSGKSFIYNEKLKKRLFIDNFDLDEYTSTGWKLGQGLTWITRNDSEKKIPQWELDSSIQEGWRPGRLIKQS